MYVVIWLDFDVLAVVYVSEVYKNCILSTFLNIYVLYIEHLDRVNVQFISKIVRTFYNPVFFFNILADGTILTLKSNNLKI